MISSCRVIDLNRITLPRPIQTTILIWLNIITYLVKYFYQHRFIVAPPLSRTQMLWYGDIPTDAVHLPRPFGPRPLSHARRSVYDSPPENMMNAQTPGRR